MLLLTSFQVELLDGRLANDLSFVGTVRTNKRFLPKCLYKKKGQVLHESTFIFSDEATLVNYQTKTRNATKRAVDTLDKMAHQYSCKDTKLAIGPVVQCLDLGTIAARVIWAKFFPDH